ncbi:hypothetical protein A3G67_03165 [Candidatus Roizmanbacteria bacterium RIFCSPLOWO2_12_FULL_40_12]|uniref:Capsular polysaccharide assembling protein CapF C-terminal domain-containing protein n=1 Tax=Candidatus Roizmanbacteria bacterium RIFCSPLOWO2_01_FULL_40_42 TaxID=1802066 RepID=A0A1F7J5F4_9BACT|nr:MAG: hypothetical protein A2779_02800 [Candidatus Roizmanbacteria bacterium RIFCSPHIGHO2_01_FULL_40_98]OGK28271.1 MAG: hypothetical protein A3C31_00165 [Candidatus Roizmanbacteria bacterium RIFCSPHIGHO2_02_FULL_40_53]OGK30507.1 MAG: hypothetical protein A2W49_02850 [Candidatus Roizmanbacteria bacterium RIFCSPHIGHO2_12_41_18]OGK36921.1 MAG: hypothetical protein A3E69_00425 [Candidatus Roizmanbacteria bacterium RIFCSPHIGHO2_12_FULL_40_130]OGK50827.1 MAG: hypothetical protein A3B50_00935 [Candi
MKHIRKVKAFHKDKRGKLSYLTHEKMRIKDVLAISSKKGAVRANHYHKKDTHLIYLIKGKFKYITRVLGKKKSKSKTIVIKAGEIVVTPPKLAHKVVFLEDSFMVVVTTESRVQSKYEADTIRLEVEK